MDKLHILLKKVNRSRLNRWLIFSSCTKFSFSLFTKRWNNVCEKLCCGYCWSNLFSNIEFADLSPNKMKAFGLKFEAIMECNSLHCSASSNITTSKCWWPYLNECSIRCKEKRDVSESERDGTKTYEFI